MYALVTGNSISIPWLPTAVSSLKSLRKRVNKIGEIIQPCLTPTGHGIILDGPSDDLTHTLTSAYIAFNIHTIFELTFCVINLCQSAARSTQSNTFSKSAKSG